MRYPNVSRAEFIDRPNRFVAHVLLDGRRETCHVKNTGRCRELLLPGATVWLCRSDNPGRKTAFDLVAVEKGPRLINIDAQAPNAVFSEWARAGHFLPDLTLVRPEQTWGGSRFDFYYETPSQRGFVEVKGVTLEENGVAAFPDAPTERGLRHVEELTACVAAGYQAHLFFVIQMADIRAFRPNDRTHPAFGAALRAADGVRLHAHLCRVTPESLVLTDETVPILL